MKHKPTYGRRQFILSAAESAAWAAIALTMKPLTLMSAEVQEKITIYDPRFPTAEPLARDWVGDQGRLIQTFGDPTELLMQLTGSELIPALQIRGVTTESLPFCLHHQLPRSQLTQHRIDRDLFIWLFQGAQIDA